MTLLVIAAALLVVVSCVHLLPLRRAAPSTASALWLSALALRALVVLLLSLIVAVALPSTELFAAASRWCWHLVLPLLPTHLPVDGHRVGHAALALPGLGVLGAAGASAVGLARATRLLRTALRRASLGTGPDGTVLVGGPEVTLAAAGLARPRVVVSTGALLTLDEEELAAGLDHERGHIARRHRYVRLVAELCYALGRLVPMGRRALLELELHLERDADRWALARRHDPFALASAICKAAGARHLLSPGFTPLAGGNGLDLRLGELLEAGERKGPKRHEGKVAFGATAVAAAVAALTTGALLMVPVVVVGEVLWGSGSLSGGLLCPP
ncbi:MAG: M56 family metallopeptidase [Thermoleophilaceae bacterium]